MQTTMLPFYYRRFMALLSLTALSLAMQSLLALSLTLLSFSAQKAMAQLAAPVVTRIAKSENDTRDYRYLTLNNSLKVLLVSDFSVPKSAAALNVHVGSHQNPVQRPGLAHFLEHMLFLGTEKYPKPGEYQEFISQHNGEANAYTGEENTHFYFDVEHGSLEPALDRFAQFFIAPVMDANFVDHERNLVNAEYLAKINDDDRREWDVIRSQLNPSHPAAVFSVGNLESLADREGQSLRDDALAFYQDHYSANLMTLVVVGNQKLDDLQKMVESRFGQIPNHNKNIDAKYPPLFSTGVLPRSLAIKPVKELRRLSFLFPVPLYGTEFQTKPWDYIGNLLGSESTGSLLALLKSLGWAESLNAGPIYKGRQDCLYEVSITLTREGVKAKDQIISTLFDYLKIATTRGVVEWRFRELQQIADLDFRFHEKKSAADTVVELAQAMQDYPPQFVLLGKYTFENYDEALIKRALGYLRSDNTLITLVAPEVATEQTSLLYQTAYSVKPGIPPILELKPAYHQKLSLPERNVFIPKNTAIKAPSMLPDGQSAKTTPSLLVNEEQFKLWFLQDRVFHSPKAELNFRFKLPMLNSSLDNAARTQLFAALILDQLNEYAYPAHLAGLDFGLTPNPRGFELNISGYTDKQSLLVNKIISAVAQADFEEQRFNKLKDDLIRSWRNEDKNLSYAVLARKIPRLQFLTSWNTLEYADALQKTTFEQFRLFANEILRGARIDALFYGNLFPQDAIKMSALIEHQLLQKPSNRLPQLVKVLRSEHPDNKSWLYVYPLDHHDHVVELYIQALSPSRDDAAHMLLLNKILQTAFYNQLRTEKQLGHVVATFSRPLKNLEASLFVVQSPQVKAEAVMLEINNFLNTAVPYITENFIANKNALLAQLREPPVSLSEQSERFWQNILLNDLEFTTQQELLAAANKITVESLQKYYQAAFLQKNRRLWLSTEKFESMNDFELIQNLAEYQQKQKGYLYP